MVYGFYGAGENKIKLLRIINSMEVFRDNIYDYLYHFPEQKIYLMYDHRFALWSWINEIKNEEFEKFSLVHIDTHHDCSEDFIEERGEEFFDNLANFKEINNFKLAKYKTTKKEIDLIGCGSFLGVALRGNLFECIYFFTRSDNASSSYRECFEACNQNKFCNTKVEYHERENFKRLKEILETNNNIFLDLDLDYFTDDLADSKKVFSEKKVFKYFNLIKNNSKNIKLITVAVTSNNYMLIKNQFVKYFNLEK